MRFLIIVFALFYHPLLATQAPEITKKLESLQTLKELDVDFRQTKTLKELGIRLDSKGTLKISRPDIWWKITEPTKMTLHFSGSSITIDSEKNSRKVELSQLSSGDPSRGIMALLPWLEFNFAAIYKGYDVESVEPNVYKFVAKDKTVPITSIQMTLTGTDIRSLTLEEPSGDSIDIEFSKPRIKK